LQAFGRGWDPVFDEDFGFEWRLQAGAASLSRGDRATSSGAFGLKLNVTEYRTRMAHSTYEGLALMPVATRENHHTEITAGDEVDGKSRKDTVFGFI
jgi:hypothetical protein